MDGTKIRLKARMPLLILMILIVIPTGIFLQTYRLDGSKFPRLLPFLIDLVAIIAFQVEAQIARKKLVALLNLSSSD